MGLRAFDGTAQFTCYQLGRKWKRLMRMSKGDLYPSLFFDRVQRRWCWSDELMLLLLAHQYHFYSPPGLSLCAGLNPMWLKQVLAAIFCLWAIIDIAMVQCFPFYSFWQEVWSTSSGLTFHHPCVQAAHVTGLVLRTVSTHISTIVQDQMFHCKYFPSKKGQQYRKEHQSTTLLEHCLHPSLS